jgi:hypothetical protein
MARKMKLPRTRACLALAATLAVAGSLLTAPAATAALDKTVKVDSRTGWQPTGLGRPGEKFAYTYISGSWTVGYPGLPYVGLEGYSDAVDRTIYQGCKFDQRWNYGLMLWTVGPKGELSLRIHDRDECLGDNDGAITVKVASQGVNSASCNTERCEWRLSQPDTQALVDTLKGVSQSKALEVVGTTCRTFPELFVYCTAITVAIAVGVWFFQQQLLWAMKGGRGAVISITLNKNFGILPQT